MWIALRVELVVRRVEVDASTAGRCLRRDLDGSAADTLSAACDREAVRGAIPVGPAESCDLSATHARGGGEMQCGVQPVMCTVLEEVRELFGCPHFWTQA